MTLITEVAIFSIIYLSAKLLGEYASRVKLPLISGYLFTGIIVGPYVLGLITPHAVIDLRFIDEISLAFIAFAAGSELFIKDLRSRFKSIGFVTFGLILSTFSLGVIAILLLSDLIPFMRDMSAVARVAVALLAASILVARSPSSAIAIIKELRAMGPFTKTALGVTVVMDVSVIVLFSVNSSIAGALLTGMGIDIGFIILLVGELISACILGFLIFIVIKLLFSMDIHFIVKSLLILLVGYSVFLFSGFVRHVSFEYFSFEFFFEPLLVCMIAGFLVSNYSAYRLEFTRIIQRVGPVIFIVFFTLTGASLSLDVLANTWSIALILFFVRLVGIAIGSFSGGIIAGDPMRYNSIGWMAYITQAGVGLGLAKEVAVEFPEMGSAFATVIIAVIVINQIVGPPFFKIAIRKAGEDNLPVRGQSDRIRDVAIFGIEGASLALARRLQAYNWKVVLVDSDSDHVNWVNSGDIKSCLISEITCDELKNFITPSTDAVVAMLEDDETNYCLCKLAREDFGVPRLITRLQNGVWREKFEELGVLVINPAAAIVNLLDQSVRAPETASTLIQVDPEFVIVQVTIADKDVVGIPIRKLRFPNDVLILRISRDQHSIEPHGYSSFHLGDEVTFMGKKGSLAFITEKYGY